jgi:hypothetical protein
MAQIMNLGMSDLPTIYNISYPVGPNMPNVRDDVMLVQTLMKIARFIRSAGGSGPVESSTQIKVDGYFGKQTKRMIEAFEVMIREKNLLIISDGVFEPSSDDGYTGKGIIYKIIHLNRFAKQASPFGNAYNQLPENPDTHPILRGSLAARGQRTARVVSL